MTEASLRRENADEEALREPALLRIEGLVVEYQLKRRGLSGIAPTIRAVDGVSLSVNDGETLALVGESGSGKTTIARAIMGLTPSKPQGEIYFEGRKTLSGTPSERRRMFRNVQMVFQNPSGSLNPSMRISECIAEPLKIHRFPRKALTKKVADLMDLVGLPARFADRSPHELSGGQQQRVGIARALALSPRLVILDEPVSALDVSVQASILNLLLDLQQELKLSYLFISHDLAVVAAMAHQIAVMYLGKIVEEGSRRGVLGSPVHPYTQTLLSTMSSTPGARIVLQGEIPSPANPPAGCRFHTRCWKAQSQCSANEPQLMEWSPDGHRHACFFPSTETA